MPVEIPAEFLVVASRGPDWADWLDRLPRLTRDLLDEWRLRVDGTSSYGNCALVVPVITADGQNAVLKVQFPHWEAETEHLALRAWGGNGAVQCEGGLRDHWNRYRPALSRPGLTDPRHARPRRA